MKAVINELRSGGDEEHAQVQATRAEIALCMETRPADGGGMGSHRKVKFALFRS